MANQLSHYMGSTLPAGQQSYYAGPTGISPGSRNGALVLPMLRRSQLLPSLQRNNSPTTVTVNFNSNVGNVNINNPGAGQPPAMGTGCNIGSSSCCCSSCCATQSFYVGTSAGQASTYIGCSGAGGEFHTDGGAGVDCYCRVHMGTGRGGTSSSDTTLLPLLALATMATSNQPQQQQLQRRQQQ